MRSAYAARKHTENPVQERYLVHEFTSEQFFYQVAGRRLGRDGSGDAKRDTIATIRTGEAEGGEWWPRGKHPTHWSYRQNWVGGKMVPRAKVSWVSNLPWNRERPTGSFGGWLPLPAEGWSEPIQRWGPAICIHLECIHKNFEIFP